MENRSDKESDNNPFVRRAIAMLSARHACLHQIPFDKAVTAIIDSPRRTALDQMEVFDASLPHRILDERGARDSDKPIFTALETGIDMLKAFHDFRAFISNANDELIQVFRDVVIDLEDQIGVVDEYEPILEEAFAVYPGLRDKVMFQRVMMLYSIEARGNALNWNKEGTMAWIDTVFGRSAADSAQNNAEEGGGGDEVAIQAHHGAPLFRFDFPIPIADIIDLIDSDDDEAANGEEEGNEEEINNNGHIEEEDGPHGGGVLGEGEGGLYADEGVGQNAPNNHEDIQVHDGVGANDEQVQVQDQVQDAEVVNNIDFHATIQLLERRLEESRRVSDELQAHIDDSQMMTAVLRQRADYHYTQSRVLRVQRNRLIMAFIIFLSVLLGIVMSLY